MNFIGLSKKVGIKAKFSGATSRVAIRKARIIIIAV